MNASPKVIHVISRPSGGGAELLVNLFAKSSNLNKSGPRNYIVSLGKSLHESKDVSFKNRYLISFGLSPRNLKNVLLLRLVFRRLLRSNSEVIVHSHLAWPLYFSAIAALGLKVKLVHTEHNSTNRRRNLVYFRALEKFIYSRYQAIICISEGVQDSLKSWIGSISDNRTTVILNGSRKFSNICNKRPSINERNIKILSVGSLSEQKNFYNAIFILDKLFKNRSLKWSYRIVGEGPERPKLDSLIKALDLEKAVSLIGWSNNLQHEYSEADLLLIPSKWEGFGLVAVEAMSCGLPVIAHKVPGLSEVLGDIESAFYINDIDDIGAWQSAFESAMREIQINGEELILSSLERASYFSIERMVSDYNQVYKKIINQYQG